jgi:hypothetical protein
MASIYKELNLQAHPDRVWDAIRDLDHAHERVFPGVLVASRSEVGARVVTFADGREVRERILTVDETHRRVAWTAASEMLSHHGASMQVFANPDGTTRLVWITDVLPDGARPAIEAIVEGGARVLAKTLER